MTLPSTKNYFIEIGRDSSGEGEVMYNVVNRNTQVIEGRFQPLPMCIRYMHELEEMLEKWTPKDSEDIVANMLKKASRE